MNSGGKSHGKSSVVANATQARKAGKTASPVKKFFTKLNPMNWGSKGGKVTTTVGRTNSPIRYPGDEKLRTYLVPPPSSVSTKVDSSLPKVVSHRYGEARPSVFESVQAALPLPGQPSSEVSGNEVSILPEIGEINIPTQGDQEDEEYIPTPVAEGIAEPAVPARTGALGVLGITEAPPATLPAPIEVPAPAKAVAEVPKVELPIPIAPQLPKEVVENLPKAENLPPIPPVTTAPPIIQATLPSVPTPVEAPKTVKDDFVHVPPPVLAPIRLTTKEVPQLESGVSPLFMGPRIKLAPTDPKDLETSPGPRNSSKPPQIDLEPPRQEVNLISRVKRRLDRLSNENETLIKILLALGVVGFGVVIYFLIRLSRTKSTGPIPVLRQAPPDYAPKPKSDKLESKPVESPEQTEPDSTPVSVIEPVLVPEDVAAPIQGVIKFTPENPDAWLEGHKKVNGATLKCQNSSTREDLWSESILQAVKDCPRESVNSDPLARRDQERLDQSSQKNSKLKPPSRETTRQKRARAS